ncbi:MAG: M23 family metallopeptidase [bacterium]|nr:M23 family metallopeptidase [bacterium]
MHRQPLRAVFVPVIAFFINLAFVNIAEAGAVEDWMDCSDDVCVFVRSAEDIARISASNNSAAPVAVSIDFTGLRNAAAFPRKAKAVVQPGGVQHLVELRRKNSRGNMSFPFKWRWVLGDPGARHDDALSYHIPFGGTVARELTQGVGGKFSHTGPHHYSFDFGMPVGTPIVAARSGVVVNVADGHNRAGVTEEFLTRANSVTILHEDGTFASYGHLDPGAGVHQGMRVRVGEVIGFSGNTGFTTGPHLHFSVWRSTFAGHQQTLPIRFSHKGRAPFEPKRGVRYPPGCYDEGRPCTAEELPARADKREPDRLMRSNDGSCHCSNGSVITTHLPCRMVCPKAR